MTDRFNNLLKNSKFYNTLNKGTPNVSDVSENTIKLNIGAGPNVFPYPGWVNFDREDISSYFDFIKNKKDNSDSPKHVQILADYLKSGGKINCNKYDFLQGFPQYKANEVDCIYIGQVIEHINPIIEVPKLLSECYRILKPGKVLRMTTPDLDLLIEAYLNNRMDQFEIEQPEFYKTMDSSAKLAMLMFGSCGPNSTWNYYEGHMFLYTVQSMTSVLKKAGFQDIVFYDESGQSKDKSLQKEFVDLGMTHSFIVEAVK